ncbi:ATP-binding protein [Aestuariibaculum suncheonense]|uniref:histidine kinase n=1 Tax=Aestuariibaculum suncheonense TaxID=1028745 RepID=A0A8J6UHT0_9FLAO|nr:ATP-binding protein [Aestuariibaculum suncheonense]MBD0835994.1 response regulator [Aestuariibaculum suncheonense]
MIKKIKVHLIIAVTIFFGLSLAKLYIYKISKDEYESVIDEDLQHTGELISKEFENIIRSDISRLENLKSRLEFTNGDYFKNWEHDANLLLEQNSSFKFIEWIDSSMVIRKIYPEKENKKALLLDISTIDYRREEWLSHSKTGATNITSWLDLKQSSKAFLVDVPVYFNNTFQGTITAGMDFKYNFERLANHLENQYVIEFFDDKGVPFYQLNHSIKLNSKTDLIYSNKLTIDPQDQQNWQLNIYPSKNLLLAEGNTIIDVAFVVGIFLAFVLSLLIFFYLQAKKSSREAIESNETLIKLNKTLKQEKDRAKKASQAKTEFLSNMSHEIRTPLHAIIGFIELLKSDNLEPTHKEYIDLMDKSSSNLLGLVNDILDFDKIESGNTELEEVTFTPLNKIQKLLEVNQFLFVKKNLYLKTNFNNVSGSTVIGDLNKLLQVINNLLKNALKFTKNGGVTFTYSETIIKEQLKLAITIEDTGIGIPKDKLDTIFNRFTQIENSIKKEHEGSGLGLAICKNLVKMMGGDIIVESEHNQGTKFTVSFLFNITKNTVPKQTIDLKKSINSADLNVLIVDDNNLNIIVLKKFLQDLGINADTANNGKIALERFNEKKYQLIFMDIHMPEMDGWEATRYIREIDKEVIIFGLSANVTTEAINKAIESGMNNYLTKPFKKERLYKLLQFHFNNENQLV